MGRPKKNKTEENNLAKGFIDIETYEEIAELAERRSEIIVNQSRKIDGLLADNKGLSEKLAVCENNDQAIVTDIKNILTRMELAFLHGINETGEITLEDVRYNLGLIRRIITKKYGRK